MKVSIITVTYNSEKTLPDTIKSVFDQTYTNIEYIVIDADSTDTTKEIVRQCDREIKFISEPDDGIQDAYNKGINIATGDVITI